MGLILDTSLLIAEERGRFGMADFLRQFSGQPAAISVITASELLHGVERASDPARREQRQQHVEQILSTIAIRPFDLAQARGQMVGPHDLLIAAAALAFDDAVATLNAAEFQRVNRLNVVDATPFLHS